ncbi:MAG: FAD-dependent oxidoreductase [Lachnospiraceae bacterium]
MPKELDKEWYPEYVYPKHLSTDDTPLREPIVKLSKMITDRIPQKLGLKKITKDDPEYWGLAVLVTDEEANIALTMGVRKPRTLKEMVKLTGISADELEPKLTEMARKGILEYNWENDAHEKQYVLPMFVPGSAEFSNMNSNILNEHPEMGIFFEHMSRLPLEKITPFVPQGGAGIGMHIIPVEKAIEMENESVDLEHISYWLSKYEGKYAASPCSCRRSRLTYDEGCADDPEGWCIAVGDMADYVVETQKDGRYITKEEALAIFKQAEENGFVHQITNIDGENKIFAICNCNVNVCYALRTSQLFNTPNMSRSAYVAKVDKEKCVACGKCVEFCPAGAVKLGQKLCKKDGSEVTYPQMPLPTEQKWGEHMWTHNYRDVNRINCYDTGTAPCKTACPAHIAIQGYLKLAKEGRYEEALALIKKDNPLPAICGHICNRRCEIACTRGTIDAPIAIDEVKRFLAERDLHADTRYIPKAVVPSLKGSFDEKIAIIGAGPAGLSCAYFLAQMGYKPVIFEKNDRAGGMLTYGIPSYKLEKDVIEAEVEVIKAMGVAIRYGVEVGKHITLNQLRTEGYKGFYLAIGCQGGRKPNIPGEDAEGAYTAVEFLREAGAKEAFPLGDDVIVIGGGNVAIDAARTAIRCGKGKVSLYCLESKTEMPASDEEVKEAVDEHISINNGWGPKEILTENGKVIGVVFKKCVHVYDKNGRFDPKYNENETITITCTNVIFSVGQEIVWGDLLKGERVELKINGAAIADKLTYQTTQPDIFVGGDVYTGPKFAIDAIAAGREGAISLHRFVHEHCTLTIGRNRRDFIELDKNDLSIGEYDTEKRQMPTKPDTRMQQESFRDLSCTFSEEQVKTESSRCLGCGASVVDPNRCIGCGICTTKCMFDAIHLKRENPGCSFMVPSEEKLKYILPNMVKQSLKIKFAPKK